MNVSQKNLFFTPNQSRNSINISKSGANFTHRKTLGPSYHHIEEDSDDLYEEYENKYINALTNKVRQYIDIVSKIAQTNSEKELRAKISKDIQKKRHNNLILKAYQNMEKQRKAKQRASEHLEDLVYKRQYLKSQRYKRVEANKKELKLKEV